MVEHNLAKVRVAGSSPVSRSNSQFGDFAFLFFLLIHLHNLQKDCTYPTDCGKTTTDFLIDRIYDTTKGFVNTYPEL